MDESVRIATAGKTLVPRLRGKPNCFSSRGHGLGREVDHAGLAAISMNSRTVAAFCLRKRIAIGFRVPALMQYHGRKLLSAEIADKNQDFPEWTGR
jgi:hypothetical protein